MAAFHRWLHALAAALLVGALAAYADALVERAVTVAPAGGRVEHRLGWDMLVAVGDPYGASALEIGLWSLNLLVLATPLLWGLRPRRLLALGPVAVLAIGFWLWGATPDDEAQLAKAAVVWELKTGYFVWLGSILALALAITLRWTAFVLALRAWQRRDGALDARIGVDPASVAHFSPTLRATIEEAADLRRLLDVSPHDERVHAMVWDWATRLQRLPEVDTAELERLRVPTRAVHAAVEPLWLDDNPVSCERLEGVDDALASFLAAATSGARVTAFR